MPVDIYIRGPAEQLEAVLGFLRDRPMTTPDQLVEDATGARLIVPSDDEKAATIHVQKLVTGICQRLDLDCTELTWGPRAPGS